MAATVSGFLPVVHGRPWSSLLHTAWYNRIKGRRAKIGPTVSNKACIWSRLKDFHRNLNLSSSWERIDPVLLEIEFCCWCLDAKEKKKKWKASLSRLLQIGVLGFPRWKTWTSVFNVRSPSILVYNRLEHVYFATLSNNAVTFSNLAKYQTALQCSKSSNKYITRTPIQFHTKAQSSL